MANQRYVLKVTTNNLRAEVIVNGVPVVILFPGEADTPVAIPINEYVVPGRNLVRIILHAGLQPSTVGAPWIPNEQTGPYQGPSSFTGRLALYDEDQTVSASNPPVLMNLDWQGTAAPQPSTLNGEFTASVSFGMWAWMTAPTLRDSVGAAMADAYKYLVFLHGLIERGDGAAFVNESQIKFQEFDRAYGVPMSPMVKSLTEGITQHASASEWFLLPIGQNGIDLRMVAGSRLIELRRKDWGHALQFFHSESGDTFFLPLMISRINNVWRILR